MQSVDVKVPGINGCRKVNVELMYILWIIITLKKHYLQSNTLHLVTKTAVTNAYLIDIFQPSLTFVKEVHFYSDIIPAIESFEEIADVPENERIDTFIQCFGSRISLETS